MNSGIAERRKTPFFQTGNELLDVFEPIVGSDCFTIYSLFARRQFRDPQLEHSVQELANAVGLGAATVSRALEILESLGLIELTRCGGSQKSKCRLLDSEAAAVRLGAKYHRTTMRWSLEKETKQHLITEVKAIRQRQQGKIFHKLQTTCDPSCPAERKADCRACRSDTPDVSTRNVGVSRQIGQHASRERPDGIYLIQEDVRRKEGPTPISSHKELEEPATDHSKEQEWILKITRSAFNAVIDSMKEQILYTSSPPHRNLGNGIAEWEEVGFSHWALESALKQPRGLTLTISVPDVTAAHRGLERYKQKWDSSIQNWFGCEVTIRFSPPRESSCAPCGWSG